MMTRYERAIRTNMASAEKDMKSAEDGRGFVIGGVLKLWEVYKQKQIDRASFMGSIEISSMSR